MLASSYSVSWFKFVDNTTVVLPVLYVGVLWSHYLSYIHVLVLGYRECLLTAELFRWCYNRTGSVFGLLLGTCILCICVLKLLSVCIKIFLKLDWLFRFCSLLYDVLHFNVRYCVYGRFFFCFKLEIENYFRSQVKSVIYTCWHGSSISS